MSKNLTIAIADEVVATHETAAIPSLVYSLGNMKADWNSLDDDVIAALSGALIDIMDSQMLSERLTANTLHGAYAHKYTRTYIHTYIHTCVHIFIYMHVYTNLYTNALRDRPLLHERQVEKFGSSAAEVALGSIIIHFRRPG